MQRQLETPHFTNLGAELSSEKFKKVLVIGLGQLGLPVAKYIKDRGFETY